MKYVESITLRNLKDFNCDELILKVNSSKKEIKLDYTKLIGLFNLLYVEISLFHPDDLAIALQLNVNNGTEKELSIELATNCVIMPHLSAYKKTFTYKREIRTINQKTLANFFDDAISIHMPRKISTPWPQTKFLNAAKTIDQFLGEDNNIYNTILHHKLYEYSQQVVIKDMVVKFSLSQISVFTRTSIRFNGTSHKFFEIIFKDFGEESFSFEFFGSTIKVSNKKIDLDKIRQIFFNIANLQGIDVSTMTEFWDFVLVRKMEMI